MEQGQTSKYEGSLATMFSADSAMLAESLYSGVDKTPASSQTAYKWSFASKTSRADNDALRAAREEIDSATYGRSQPSSSGPSGGRVMGPTMPSAADRTLARETADEYRAADREYQRKRERKEAKERIEDMVGPKELGRAAGNLRECVRLEFSSSLRSYINPIQMKRLRRDVHTCTYLYIGI